MKKWYLSKTLWVNVVALVAIIAQGVTGKDVLAPEVQGSILAIINLILRAVTKQQLTLK
jgi:hypothetical protein